MGISAIASSSLATEWLKGKNVDQATEIRNTDIADELSLPPVKIHCSVLAEDAVKAAIQDWKRKNASQADAESGCDGIQLTVGGEKPKPQPEKG